MDLNWCPVCEQHIPLAWESSLYCSERCKQADEHASSPALGYSYPAEMQSFARNNNKRNSPVMSLSSPMSSPTLAAVSPNSNNNNNNNAAYPSPPTSPMSNYLYNKTSSSGRVSPPAFSLGYPAYDLELRRKSTTTIVAPQYMMPNTTSNAKKGLFW